MKELTTRQWAIVKRVAQNVHPLVSKREKLFAKRDEIEEEMSNIDTEIEGHEGGIIQLSGGLTSENLVTRVLEDTGKKDANGKEIKITKYVPNERIVKYNPETKLYEITNPFSDKDEDGSFQVDDQSPIEEREIQPNEFKTPEPSEHPIMPDTRTEEEETVFQDYTKRNS